MKFFLKKLCCEKFGVNAATQCLCGLQKMQLFFKLFQSKETKINILKFFYNKTQNVKYIT